MKKNHPLILPVRKYSESQNGGLGTLHNSSSLIQNTSSPIFNSLNSSSPLKELKSSFQFPPRRPSPFNDKKTGSMFEQKDPYNLEKNGGSRPQHDEGQNDRVVLRKTPNRESYVREGGPRDKQHFRQNIKNRSEGGSIGIGQGNTLHSSQGNSKNMMSQEGRSGRTAIRQMFAEANLPKEKEEQSEKKHKSYHSTDHKLNDEKNEESGSYPLTPKITSASIVAPVKITHQFSNLTGAGHNQRAEQRTPKSVKAFNLKKQNGFSEKKEETRMTLSKLKQRSLIPEPPTSAITRAPLKKLGLTKASTKKNGCIHSYAANTNCGLIRNYNEDRVSIILNLNRPGGSMRPQNDWPVAHFFGVFDGHGGQTCAEYLRDNFHKIVNRLISLLADCSKMTETDESSWLTMKTTQQIPKRP